MNGSSLPPQAPSLIEGRCELCSQLASQGSWDWCVDWEHEPWASGAAWGQVRICFCPAFQCFVFIRTIHTNDSALLGLGEPGVDTFKETHSGCKFISYVEGWGFSYKDQWKLEIPSLTTDQALLPHHPTKSRPTRMVALTKINHKCVKLNSHPIQSHCHPFLKPRPM